MHFRLRCYRTPKFVQDLSQLKGVYPRCPTFLANVTQQYFGMADCDTGKYIIDLLGPETIQFRTASTSLHTGFRKEMSGSGSVGTGEHLQGRSLLTPDEVLSLSRDQAIVWTAGERPYAGSSCASWSSCSSVDAH